MDLQIYVNGSTLPLNRFKGVAQVGIAAYPNVSAGFVLNGFRQLHENDLGHRISVDLRVLELDKFLN